MILKAKERHKLKASDRLGQLESDACFLSKGTEGHDLFEQRRNPMFSHSLSFQLCSVEISNWKSYVHGSASLLCR